MRARASAEALKRELVSKLDFTPEISIHSADDVVAFVDRDPFRGARFTKERRGWVTANVVSRRARG